MTDETTPEFRAALQAFEDYGTETGRASALSLAAQFVAFCLIPPDVYVPASHAERVALQSQMERLVLECIEPLLEPAGMATRNSAGGAPN